MFNCEGYFLYTKTPQDYTKQRKQKFSLNAINLFTKQIPFATKALSTAISYIIKLCYCILKFTFTTNGISIDKYDYFWQNSTKNVVVNLLNWML